MSRIQPTATVQGSVACHVRPAGRLAGPRPAGPVQPGRRPACHAVVRSSCVLAEWSPHVARVRWRARRRPGGKVLPASSWGPQGGRRARRGAGGAHRGGGATTGQRGGSVRRRAVGSSPEGGSAASSWSCGGGRER
jgi:hypothetical protein